MAVLEMQGTYRKFEEHQDADLVRMTMVAIWEAQETMERGIAEGDHPSGFIGQRATAEGGRVPFNEMNDGDSTDS
jgi:hypothetical protein